MDTRHCDAVKPGEQKRKGAPVKDTFGDAPET
jgi:hypothetical protein